MKVESSKIALFGGSFDPPHIGHVEICRYLLRLSECDQIWIIPCFQHPFGKIMAPFDDRLAMCRFTFQEFREKVWITDIERRLGGVSHTVRTITHLKHTHPGKDFSLVLGTDVSGEKKEWKDFDAIKEAVGIIEVPRGPGSPIPNVSSSDIRRRIREGGEYSRLVAEPVSIYIVTHGLYQ